MLIAIEGIDGSGKGTQAARLVSALHREGRSAALLGFPRYDQTFFGARVGEFLNGKYGALDAVDPFLVSLLFAGDRWESKPLLEETLARHDVVVLDRYVPSNVAHQVAKADGDRRGMLRQWIEHVEYDLFGLPRPNRVILLDLPASSARELIAKKARRTYTDDERDLQEADLAYQERVRQFYRELAANDPAWRRVDVVRDGQVRPLDDVARDVAAAAR